MRTVLLGLDAFDPAVFERMAASGQLPTLEAYVSAGAYARLAVADPPQSEVSWTSIATGLSPGGHGLFDFVHREPGRYQLRISLLPTRSGPLGTRFVPPYEARTIFDRAAELGFPATALWWPALFPARQHSPVRTIPGLGTPDVHGRFGVGTLFTSDADHAAARRKTPVAILRRLSPGRHRGLIAGPARHARSGPETTPLAFQLEEVDDQTARLALGPQRTELRLGVWSPILEITFRVGPLLALRALTRVILTQVRPELRCYMLPLQIHPLHPIWPYATPPGFVKQVWREAGMFLTLGWPQDTTALEEGLISDEQFLSLCDDIFRSRSAVFLAQAGRLHEGLLGGVFDCLDRVQHMFWRRRPDIVEGWYRRLDHLVGETARALAGQPGSPARLIVASDHGFSEFRYKVHLNRWLIERGYLVAEGGAGPGSLQRARWPESRAYALGLNSLYLNLAGREGQGRLADREREPLLRELRQELLSWRGPDNQAVVQRVLAQGEAFDGPFASAGPDLVVGYAPGYRASAQTGLGEWGDSSLEPNFDHWEADHCIAAEAVPGVLFVSGGLDGLRRPSYRDIPALALGAHAGGMHPQGGAPPPNNADDDEGQELVEQRLKDLGYL